ncbi:MAG: hypothetical protein COA84_12800 [Robiginitomaculum sp.]|nr:MAG: hypothetical protein COA84_12800 [Robiginitomaculum sp.]
MLGLVPFIKMNILRFFIMISLALAGFVALQTWKLDRAHKKITKQKIDIAEFKRTAKNKGAAITSLQGTQARRDTSKGNLDDALNQLRSAPETSSAGPAIHMALGILRDNPSSRPDDNHSGPIPDVQSKAESARRDARAD